MKPCKEPLTYSACKYFFYKLISIIARPKPIAMPDVKLLPVVFFVNRVAVKFYSYLLCEIIEYPHIVVAGKIVNVNSFIIKLCKLTEYSNMTSWNYSFVFKPEIKNISEKVKLFAIIF